MRLPGAPAPSAVSWGAPLPWPHRFPSRVRFHEPTQEVTPAAGSPLPQDQPTLAGSPAADARAGVAGKAAACSRRRRADSGRCSGSRCATLGSGRRPRRRTAPASSPRRRRRGCVRWSGGSRRRRSWRSPWRRSPGCWRAPRRWGTRRWPGRARGVAGWAEAEGKLALALGYAQAVALVRTGEARAAYAVGLLARRRAEYARAETWFRRAVMLARQSGDWPAYCLAFVGLGEALRAAGGTSPPRGSCTSAPGESPAGTACASWRRWRSTTSSWWRRTATRWRRPRTTPRRRSRPTGRDTSAFPRSRTTPPTSGSSGAASHGRSRSSRRCSRTSTAPPTACACSPTSRARPRAPGRETSSSGRGERRWRRQTGRTPRRGEAQALLDLAHGAAMLRRWAKAGPRGRARARGRGARATSPRSASRRRRSSTPCSGARAAESTPAPDAGARTPRGDALASDLVEHLGGAVSDAEPAGESYLGRAAAWRQPEEPR